MAAARRLQEACRGELAKLKVRELRALRFLRFHKGDEKKLAAAKRMASFRMPRAPKFRE